MSTENQGEVPDGEEEYWTEPTAQFDAFRARRDDDRTQQETQSAYVFPEEYAADPNAVFPPQQPPIPPYGDGYGPGPGGQDGGGPGNPRQKWRSVAIFGGAVLVAAALGLGVWAAFDSGGSSTTGSASAAGATATSTATSTATAGKHAKNELTFRVTIAAVGADSFTGTVLANGDTVTVVLNSKTHFGTKAHPFERAELSVGETVIVRGHRTGTDKVTATTVAENVASSSAPTGDAAAGAAA